VLMNDVREVFHVDHRVGNVLGKARGRAAIGFRETRVEPSSMIRRPQRARLVWAALLILAVSTGELCAEETPAQPSPVEAPGAALSLADLVTEATEVAGRYAELEKALTAGFDLAATRQSIADRRGRVEGLTRQLEALKASKAYGYDQLAELKAAVRTEAQGLSQVADSLSGALAAAETVRKEWAAEKERWATWHASIPEDAALKSVKATVGEAQKTIEKALSATAKALDPMLAAHREAGDGQNKIQTLAGEIDALLQAVRTDVFRKSAPSMFSREFYGHFGPELWTDIQANLAALPRLDRGFFAAQGWVVALQILIAAALTGAIVWQARVVGKTEKWGFLHRRPLAAGLFVGVSAGAPLYLQIPPVWRFVLWVAVGVSAARLLAALISGHWKRRILYLLVAVFLATELLRVIGLPGPLFRLCVLLVAAGGALLCLWRARVNARRGDHILYVFALRLGGAVLAIVFLSQAAGYSALAAQLLGSSIQSTFLVLLAWMLALLARGAVEFAMGDRAFGRYPPVHRVSGTVGRRLGVLIDALVGALALAFLLWVWRLYDTPLEALERLMGFGFFVGGQKVSVGLGLSALGVFYASHVASAAVQAVLMEHVYPRRHMEYGARLSMNRLLHYAFMLIGFLTAVSVLGVELRNVTIVAGAFGIGIGFGLQTIVNNFVSGLILLFERPVKVGDLVQLGAQSGTIERLGLRATVLRTADHSEVIVPNSDLISAQVVNWTLSDRRSRVVVLVGIAYGSDVPAAMELLQEIAEAHPLVLRDPKPRVLFQAFGASSLDLELQVWLADVDHRPEVRSDLHREIDRRFREAGIEIPFPQQDVHLRSADAGAARAIAALPARAEEDEP